MRVHVAQINDLDRQALRDYAVQMVEHLREQLPKKAARFTDDELKALVISGADRARGYGLVLGAEIAQFLYLMLVLGPDFDEAPQYAAIRRALARSDIDNRTKLNHSFTLLLT